MMLNSRLPFACLFSVCALFVLVTKAKDLSECADEGFDEYVINLTPGCSDDYPFVYCDGQQSMYCATLNDCNESYECVATAPIDVPVLEPIVVPWPEPIDVPVPEPIIDPVPEPIDVPVPEPIIAPGPEPIVIPAPVPVRQRCVRGVTAKYAYPNNCHYFYQCIDGYLLVQQCPIGFVFNATDALCWDFRGEPEPISCASIN